MLPLLKNKKKTDEGERCLQANDKKKRNKIKPVLLAPAVPAEEAVTEQQDRVLLETTRSTSVGPALALHLPSAYRLRGVF